MGRKITKPYMDDELKKIFSDIDYGRLPKKLSPFYTRPAYGKTNTEVGGIDHESPNVQ